MAWIRSHNVVGARGVDRKAVGGQGAGKVAPCSNPGVAAPHGELVAAGRRAKGCPEGPRLVWVHPGDVSGGGRRVSRS